jgi:hypothetical protein
LVNYRRDAAKVYANGGRRLSRIVPNTDTLSGHHDVLIRNGLIPRDQVTRIEFSTNSDDLFVMDEVEVLDVNGNRYFAAGIDNMVGYCLSTDSTTTNEHCRDYLSRSTWVFSF